MVSQQIRQCGLIILVATFQLVATAVTAQGSEPADQPGSSRGGRLSGKIRSSDRKSLVEGATVHVYHLGSGQTFSSEPTGPQGTYELTGLPFGYFDVAVETAEGMFVSDQIVNVPPSGKVLALFTLRKYEELSASWWSSHERREFPGSGQRSTGVAQTRLKRRGAEFWKSTKGIALLAGTGGALLLVLAASDEETTASPSTP